MRAVDYARKLYAYTNIEIPPIDLNSILKELGIKLKGLDLAYIDAVLIKDKDFPVIGYNLNKSVERQRFSIAHEIGHFVLPECRDYCVCNIDSASIDEKDANIFAEELLMPRHLLEKLWYEYRNNKEYRLEHISHLLQVSKTALNVRIRRIHLR